MDFFQILIGTLIGLLIIWLYRKWNQRVAYFHSLQKMGVPTLPVNVLGGGHLFRFMKGKSIEIQRELLTKYGDISGYYFGNFRNILLANYELIREVFIRRASEFSNRAEYFQNITADPKGFMQTSLINLKDQKWKNHRSLISRSFTDSKLELLKPIMFDRVMEMINIIQKKNGEETKANNLFKRLTLDVIGSCAFGVASNCQVNDESTLLQASEQIFNSHKIIRRYLLSFLFDNLRWPVRQSVFFNIWLNNKLYGEIDAKKHMVDVCRAILQNRLKQADQETKRVDLLHCMLEASNVGKNQSSINTQANGCPFDSSKNFTQEELVSNMILFYEAGYETSSTALIFMTHLLINFPLQQRRLRAEVLRVLHSENLLKLAEGTNLSSEPTNDELLNTSFTYDTKELQHKLSLSIIRKLHYMDCFIKESMRVYPPIWSFIGRNGSKNPELRLPGNKEPIKLPNDVHMKLPIIYIHHDPNYWYKPFNFRPQRFSTIINDNNLSEAELIEQQQEWDSYNLKDCPSLKFSDNQPKDIPLEELDSETTDLNHDLSNLNDWDSQLNSETKKDENEDEYQTTKSSQMLLKRVDPAHYMPFGLGPRNCIGTRFALLEIKLTLVMLLLNFEMVSGKNNPKGVAEIEFKSATLSVKNDVHVNFRPNKLIKTK